MSTANPRKHWAQESRRRRLIGGLAVLVLLLLAHGGGAAAADRQSHELLAHQSDLALQFEDYTHVFTAADDDPHTARSMPALLSAIATWLEDIFGLAAAGDPPRVEFTTPARITAMRYGPLASGLQATPSDHRGTIGAGHSVVAVYDDSRQTIYLPEGWSAASPADISVLVHEMVHHVQARAQHKYYCPQEREKLAYEAQERWLARFGRSLQGEFEIDPVTLLVQTSCMM
jgi:hypothetical protein